MARPTKRRSPPRRAPLEVTDERLVPLRLSVTKAGLGLELAEPIAIGFMEMDQLSIALTGLSFPLDLSSGVARFRHRRGALERFSLTARREKVVSAMAPRLRGALGGATPAFSLADLPGGVMVGMCEGQKALAFDLLWAPSEADARWIVCGARAIGLAAPALAIALQAAATAAGSAVAQSGALLAFPDAATVLARHALPAIGARVPDARGVRFGPLESNSAEFRIACDQAFAPPLLSPRVVQELEFARLAETADTALARGLFDDARASYLALLEQSPRDAELARRIAEVDRAAGGRSEAALSTLLETMPAAEAGTSAAELLASAGDGKAALLAFRQAAEREPYGSLAALALLRASTLAPEREKKALLDQAIARAPALEPTRWARLEMLLQSADLVGAMADAEHLEAAARGARRRHEVWRHAAERFLAHGHHGKAVTLFERALRYVPEEPSALTGLARSLLKAGRTGRALSLMARAVELAEEKGVESFAAVLQLAPALAESTAHDSHAVARLRTIPAGRAETLDARGLEGRYRAALGDRAGASLAYAKLRETIESAPPAGVDDAVAWLVEAAHFERESKGDPRAAQRHLSVALELSPNNKAVLTIFRQVSAEIS
jgi:tetratricopeptide (TPR) repeat protein